MNPEGQKLGNPHGNIFCARTLKKAQQRLSCKIKGSQYGMLASG
jgi:hypothetical protein